MTVIRERLRAPGGSTGGGEGGSYLGLSAPRVHEFVPNVFHFYCLKDFGIRVCCGDCVALRVNIQGLYLPKCG